ncbi:YjbE family putative metal transport protein [Candidatus Azambacteria bacterium]|nr:YjbE family putative metal transport protein [Candidatus Azambacteria bacterium]
MSLEIIWPLMQIIAIDIMMAADNAIVVGMAAAAVAPEKRKKVLIYGTLIAVVMRIVFALVAVSLLKVIGLTLAGGLLLAYVCWDMYRAIKEGRDDEKNNIVDKEEKKEASIMRAIMQVVIADISMSLDNVLAVAGAAGEHTNVLILGLFISVTLMAVAASALANMIHKHRWIEWIGLIMITYVAVSMIWHGLSEVAKAIN